jgi:hypothetical protein
MMTDRLTEVSEDDLLVAWGITSKRPGGGLGKT